MDERSHRCVILCFLTRGPLASVCQGTGDDSVPRPGVIEVSAVEQSAWLDQSIPKMMAAMGALKEVRAKVAGPLVVEKVAPFPLTPAAAGLAQATWNGGRLWPTPPSRLIPGTAAAARISRERP